MALDAKAAAAARAFRDKLLADPTGVHVKKIVAFGSRTKGLSDTDSDLDILVVAGHNRLVADVVARSAFEIQVDHGVGLEPVLVSVDELFPRRSYFIESSLRIGTEVYAVSGEELKKEERRNLLSLSEEYLAGAEEMIKRGLWRLAVDAAYNAAELAVKSLILAASDDLPGSHGGLVGRFGELYVKPGKLDREYGRRMNGSLQKRNRARYMFSASIGRDDAEETASLARDLQSLARADLGA